MLLQFRTLRIVIKLMLLGVADCYYHTKPSINISEETITILLRCNKIRFKVRLNVQNFRYKCKSDIESPPPTKVGGFRFLSTLTFIKEVVDNEGRYEYKLKR